MRSRHYDTRWGVRQTSGISFFGYSTTGWWDVGGVGAASRDARVQSVNGDIGDLCGRPGRLQQER